MVFKWNEDTERKLLMLALAQHPKTSVDAEAIRSKFPDVEKPSKDTLRTRIGQLRAQAEVLDFSTGWKSNKNPIKPGAGVGAATVATPSRRKSTNSKNTSSRKSSTNGKTSNLVGADDDFQPPATPLKQEEDVFSTFATIGQNSNSSGQNSINSLHTTNGTSSHIKASKKADHNRAWANESTASDNTNGKKRKHSAMSDSESAAATSEDELATPTKTINSSSPIPFVELSAPSPDLRRPSLPRRSKSATPGKVTYTGAEDDGADGTGKDDATKEIDSGEEWNGDDEGTPSKKVKKNWKERTGLTGGGGDDD